MAVDGVRDRASSVLFGAATLPTCWAGFVVGVEFRAVAGILQAEFFPTVEIVGQDMESGDVSGHDVVVVIETDHQRLSLLGSGVEVTLHAAHPLVFQPLEAGFLLTREAFVDAKHAAQFARLELLLELVDQASVVMVVVTCRTCPLLNVVGVRPFVAAL